MLTYSRTRRDQSSHTTTVDGNKVHAQFGRRALHSVDRDVPGLARVEALQYLSSASAALATVVRNDLFVVPAVHLILGKVSRRCARSAQIAELVTASDRRPHLETLVLL